MRKVQLVLTTLLISMTISTAQAFTHKNAGLVIHAAEIGVGKFHRKDNSVHPYAANNIWSAYIMPNGTGETTPVVVNQKDGSVSIFFSSLQELLETSLKISKERNQPISILNLNGHGTPGGMWFPMDEAQRKSVLCSSWREAAKANDRENYDQYYSPVEKSQIMQIRSLADSSGSANYPCITGVDEWKKVVARIPGLKAAFALDAQLHFFSCTVGLGKRGDKFTKGIAELLLSSEQGRVETSLPFGLGDWSMSEGMGFWDYQSDSQLDHDNANYPNHRKDSEQMQKGHIRVAVLKSAKDNQIESVSGLIKNVDFMYPGKDTRIPSQIQNDIQYTESEFTVAPEFIRIPGTQVILKKLAN